MGKNIKRIFVEIADTPEKREEGLMFRKSLGQDEGMLFKFPSKSHLSFWMKNTYVPLDIAFIDDNFTIFQIQEMFPLSTRSIGSKKPCRYALEMNHGWFDKNKVSIGTKIKNIDAEKKNIVKDSGNIKHLRVKGQVATDEFGVPATGNPNEDPSQPQESKPSVEVQALMNVREKIDYAKEHGLEMEIVYMTKEGHYLPPRRVMPLPDGGYEIKNGENGPTLVAQDVSPTISGGEGWEIKGMQPKSFILKNIMSLEVIEKDEGIKTSVENDKI